MDELEQSRMAEYAASEERIGITKEVWFLAGTPGGDTLVAYIESDDFGEALTPELREQEERLRAQAGKK